MNGGSTASDCEIGPRTFQEGNAVVDAERRCRSDSQARNNDLLSTTTTVRSDRGRRKAGDHSSYNRNSTERPLAARVVDFANRIASGVKVLMEREGIIPTPPPRIHPRKPSHPWIHPPCSVVLPAGVGIERFAGEGVRLHVRSGVSEQLAEGGVDEPGLVRQPADAPDAVGVVEAHLPAVGLGRVGTHDAQQVVAADVVGEERTRGVRLGDDMRETA